MLVADGEVLAGVDGGVEGGVDDGGAEEDGAEEDGVDDGGVEEGGVEEGGAEDGGVDDGGADDEDLVGFAEAELVGFAEAELVGFAEAELVGFADEELTGVGSTDVLENRDRAGVRYALGEIEAEGEAEDDARGLACGLEATAGWVAAAPAPACGWAWPAEGVRSAPIKAKAATAEPATSPPLRQAEASDREIRCRPGRPGLAGG